MFACGIDVVSPLSLFPQSSLFFWVLPIFACEQFPLNCDLPQFSFCSTSLSPVLSYSKYGTSLTQPHQRTTR